MTTISEKVEIAFVSNPYGALTWTDVSDHVVEFDVTRGRQYELDQNQAGVLNVTLINIDGRFDPTNTTSPYHPYVLPYRPIRVAATVDGVEFPVFYGFVERWPQTWPVGSYGRVKLVAVDAFKTVLGFSPGDPYDVKLEKDYGIYGASGSSAVWWLFAFDEAAAPFVDESPNAYSATVEGTGTVVKAQPSPCRTAVVFDGQESLVMPSELMSQGELWFNPALLPAGDGQVQVIAWSGGQVNSVGYFGSSHPSDLPAIGFGAWLWHPFHNRMPSDDAASFETSTAGWTCEESGVAVTRDVTVAYAGSASLKATVTSGTPSRIALDSAYFAPPTGFASVTVRVRTVSQQVSYDLSVSCYDTSGRYLGSASGQASAATYTPTAGQWAALSLLNFVPLPGTSQIAISVGAAGVGASLAGDVCNIDAIMLAVGGTDPNGTEIISQGDAPFVLPSVTRTPQIIVAAPAQAASTLTVWQADAPTVNQWHHLGWKTAQATGNDTDAFAALDGGILTATTAARSGSPGNTYRIGAASKNTTPGVPVYGFHGQIAAVYFEYGGGNTGIIDVTPLYAAQHFNYGTTGVAGIPRSRDFPSQLTSDRVNDVLTAVGWPDAMRDIQTGVATMTASGSASGTTGLSLIQDAATAEIGNVYVSADGKVAFRDRGDRSAATVAVTLGEQSGELHYLGDIELDFDDEHLYTDVQVTQGGSSPTFIADLSDADAEAVYGVLTLAVTSNNADQADVQETASVLLARYKAPQPRIPQASFELLSDPGQAADVLGLDIGALVTVNRRPPGASVISVNCFVDGVKVTVDRSSQSPTFTVQLQLTPQYPA